MISASGSRIGWVDLPGHVRRAVEDIVGAPVVEAVTQPGGFSPGTADRVRTADGRRAFVKAVSPAQNPDSPRMCRREIRVTAALPDAIPAPRLLGSHDDGTWVAMVLADVPGRHPELPWRADELDRVLATLDLLARVATPAPVPELPTAADSLAADFAGWRRIAADPPAELDPWLAEHLGELTAMADRGLAALTGETLVHLDIRADNLLLGADGAVTVVDWPWACRGPAWLDRLLLLVNVRLYGGHDPHALLARCAADTATDPADLLAVLAGFTAYFADVARRPDPPGLPTVRAFQRAQGDALLSWLREAMAGAARG
ncbi:phosphotransferase [Plantactinospora sp. KBS50]|uniref:phosphotransferase n=1 Tax=Plantactinospora sp. KBS50 TaxID=2024580 RepID=UPI0018E000E2|nr:phosphotransferase [Plantactinospora sp. KBS50]